MFKFPQPSLQIAIDFDTDPKLVDELLQVVQDEINNFIKNGPTDKEMKEIKLYLSKVYQDRKEDTNWIGLISGALKSEENLSLSEVTMLDKTTAADIKKFANKVFKANNRMTFIFEPKK
jgi:predicted Zn-dependent peptidase